MDESITVCQVGVLVVYGRGHYILSSGGVSFAWKRPLQSVEWGLYLCMDEAITFCRVEVLVVYGRGYYSLSSVGVSCVWTRPLHSVELWC